MINTKRKWFNHKHLKKENAQPQTSKERKWFYHRHLQKECVWFNDKHQNIETDI